MTGDQPWSILLLCWILAAGGAFLVVRALDAASDLRLVGALAAVSGCLCAWTLAHGSGGLGVVVVWCICTVLDAAVCADLRTKRVPPVLVLPVLLLTIAVDVHGADWAAFFPGLAILAGVGFAWMRSKGRASGLGDAELAAVAGFALGLELGT
ncbi:MAG: prepilin peptidase, partial [Candidatus Eremiobacteraeota bacterium]|nr:prepilin peptidase [Candidatus Eremiobacteraeota bacterium]